MYHEYFPECFVQLQLEISHHPLLIQRIQKHQQIDMEVIIAEICHYIGYAIDGTFDGEQLAEIADTLIFKLRDKKVLAALTH